MTKQRKLAYLALFLTSLSWGFSPPIIKYSLRFVSPVSFLFFRFSLACLLFSIPLVYKIIKTKPSFYDWGQYLLLGFLSTPFNLLLYFWGVQRTSAIDASVVAILAPVLIIIGGVAFLHEKLTRRESLGIFIAIIGTGCLTLIPILRQTSESQKNFLGNLFIIGGDIVWALFALLSKTKKNHHLDSFILSAFSFFVGWLTLLPLFLAELSKTGVSAIGYLDQRAVPGIVYMAVFSSVIAYSAYTYGLKKIEASEASVFTYLQPLFAIPVAILLLGEKLTLTLVIGAVLITAGVWVCESRPQAKP